MFEPRLSAAIAAGSTVVTPNKRLARALIAEHDRAQHASGRRAWPAARVLPWSAWLGQGSGDVLAQGALPSIARLLRTSQTRRRWQPIAGATDAAALSRTGETALAAPASATST